MSEASGTSQGRTGTRIDKHAEQKGVRIAASLILAEHNQRRKKEWQFR
jgi:hypothetical protein